MRILIACECSGVVREAFRRRGHDAWSCDLKPAEDGSAYHIQADALYWSRRRVWNLMIAHPECLRLCNSGVLRLYRDGKKKNGRDPLKWQEMVEAAQFFREFLYAPIPRIAVENSIMHGHAKALIDPHCESWDRQIVQPHQFGEDASKATLLTLKGLPRLIATRIIAPSMVDGRPRWANQTDSLHPIIAPQTAPAPIRALPKRWLSSGGACPITCNRPMARNEETHGPYRPNHRKAWGCNRGDSF